jgi:hypothetical protein
MKITKQEYERIEKFFEALMEFKNPENDCDIQQYNENDNIHKVKIINGNKRIVRQFKRFDCFNYSELTLILEKFIINDKCLAETTSRITAKGKYIYEYFFYEEVLNKYNLLDIK